MRGCIGLICVLSLLIPSSHSLLKPEEGDQKGRGTYSELFSISFTDDTGSNPRRIHIELLPGEDVGDVAQNACLRHSLSDAVCREVMLIVGDQHAKSLNVTRGAVAALSHSDAIQRLFGMKQTYPTFGQAAEAALDPSAFHSLGSWLRFQEMLGDAATSAGWPNYREFSLDPLFQGDEGSSTRGVTDQEAADQAHANSADDADLMLYAVGDASYGYLEGALPDVAVSPLPTLGTCRDAMFLTSLTRVLREGGAAGLSELEVVQIGGGSGSMARVAGRSVGFRSWTILDAGYMVRLQADYLRHTLEVDALVNALQGEVSEHTASSHLVVNLVDKNHVNTWHSGGFDGGWGGADVAISTSKLSEVGMDEFWWYHAHVISRVKYVVYGYRQGSVEGMHSEAVQQDKVRAMLKGHRIMHSHQTSGGLVTLVLQRRDANPP